MRTLKVQNFGPIQSAEVSFGDLTVFVGPQASGKSIFLQLGKLLMDIIPIRNEFNRFSIEWAGSLSNFLELYFGEGMSGLYHPQQTTVEQDGAPVQMEKLILGNTSVPEEHMFYIPAQRVMSLREGLTRPFSDYRSGDPFVLREFSERLHFLMQSEFAQSPQLFPHPNRLKKPFLQLLSKNIFGGFSLKTDVAQFQKRIVMSASDGQVNLPYLVWSAGQREFAPLLLGLYWLMPPSQAHRRNALEWVIIEEPEMGLHPHATSTVLALVMELLWRGYKVCLSTHSPHVLDVVWALRLIQTHQGNEKDVLDIFGLPDSQEAKELAASVLLKTAQVYFFQRDGQVKDISNLDPGAEQPEESGWGGLTEFSSNVSEIVARVVNRASQKVSS